MPDEAVRIVLTPDEQKELRRLMHSPKFEQRQALRASIVWHLAVDRMCQAEVAAKLNMHCPQSLLASFDITKGQVVASCGSTRTVDDLVAFMEHVAVQYRQAKKVTVVWDNLNIDHDGPSNRWTAFDERHGDKYDFRYTPLHASWLNQVEIFFSILHRRCLKHGSFISVENLQDTVLDFVQRWNEKDGHAFDWCFRGYPIQSQPKAVA